MLASCQDTNLATGQKGVTPPKGDTESVISTEKLVAVLSRV